MSLINKLLKDLEKRQAYLYQDQDHMLDGLSSAYDLHQNTINNRPFIVSLIACVLFLLILLWAFQDNLETIVADIFIENKNISHNSNVAINENKNEKANRTIEKNVNKTGFLQFDMGVESNIQPPEPIKDQLNVLRQVELYKTDSGLEVKMENSLDIDYFVYNLSEPSRTVIEIENTHLGFPFEDLQPVEPVSAIRYSINSHDRLKLVFESSRTLTIDKSVTRQTDEKHLLVVSMNYSDNDQMMNAPMTNTHVNLQQEIESVTNDNAVYKGELIKTPSSQKHTLLAEKLFKEAYSLYREKNISESLRLLNKALDQDAAHVNARSTLATVLSEQGHYDLAYSVLNEGLIQFPDVTQWRMLYARMLVKQEQYVKAEQTIAVYKPRISDNTDYYALHAAILQKLNDHNQSARLYRDLLHINPNNSIWWMGLGISLESLLRYEDALYAYQKALSYPVLVNESKIYVTNRITALTNLINDESS